MCYMPNLSSRTCRFGPVVSERKLVRRCVFCGWRRPHDASRFNKWANNTCLALTTPGHLVIEPGQEIKEVFRYHGLLVGQDRHGRVAQVWIPTTPRFP